MIIIWILIYTWLYYGSVTIVYVPRGQWNNQMQTLGIELMIKNSYRKHIYKRIVDMIYFCQRPFPLHNSLCQSVLNSLCQSVYLLSTLPYGISMTLAEIALNSLFSWWLVLMCQMFQLRELYYFTTHSSKRTTHKRSNYFLEGICFPWM